MLFALDYILQNVVLKRKNPNIQVAKKIAKKYIVSKLKQKNLQDPCRATDYPVECTLKCSKMYM